MAVSDMDSNVLTSQAVAIKPLKTGFWISEFVAASQHKHGNQLIAVRKGLIKMTRFELPEHDATAGTDSRALWIGLLRFSPDDIVSRRNI